MTIFYVIIFILFAIIILLIAVIAYIIKQYYTFILETQKLNKASSLAEYEIPDEPNTNTENLIDISELSDADIRDISENMDFTR